MKIRVVFTVDIDPEAWCEIYGVNPAEIRDDVRAYIEQSFHMHCVDQELLAKPSSDG